jgi:hypothetical protein
VKITNLVLGILTISATLATFVAPNSTALSPVAIVKPDNMTGSNMTGSNMTIDNMTTAKMEFLNRVLR